MQRRNFSPEFKLQCVLDLISGRKRPAQLCREHNISESLLSRWQRQFTDEAARIFEPKQKRDSASAQRTAELEGLVGRLTLELEASKKVSSYFDSK